MKKVQILSIKKLDKYLLKNSQHKNLSMDSIKQKAFYIAMSEKYDKIYLDTKGALNGKRSLL
jgi:hypothetical protein